MQVASLAGLLAQPQGNGLDKPLDGSSFSGTSSQLFGSLLNSGSRSEPDAAASESAQSYASMFLARLSNLSEVLQQYVGSDLSDGTASVVIDDLETALVDFDRVAGTQLSEVFADDLAQTAVQISVAANSRSEPSAPGDTPDSLSGLVELVTRTILTLRSLVENLAASGSNSFVGQLSEFQTTLVAMDTPSQAAVLSTLDLNADFLGRRSISGPAVVSTRAVSQPTKEATLQVTMQGAPIRSPSARDSETRSDRGLTSATGAMPGMDLARSNEIAAAEGVLGVRGDTQKQSIAESASVRGALKSSNVVVPVASADTVTRPKAEARSEVHAGKHALRGAGTGLKPDVTTLSRVESLGFGGPMFAGGFETAPSMWRSPTIGAVVLPTNSYDEMLFSSDLAQTNSVGERVSGTERSSKDILPASSRFTQAIVSQLRISEIGEGTTRVELSPRGLGSVEIEVSTDIEGVVSVVIRAENNAVLTALRDAREHLIHILSSGQGGDLSFENKSSGQDTNNDLERTENSERELEQSNGEVPLTLVSQKAQIISEGYLDILT